ncbi:MAG: class I adenylate-forming enzyme family protein [Gemmatimonadaceae bacterium]
MMNLLAIYESMADEKPDELALIYRREPYVGETRTWGQLRERSEFLTKRLIAANFPEGGLCAVVLTDNPDMLPLLMAIWRLRGVAVLADKMWGDRLRESVFSHSQPNAFVSLEPELTVTLMVQPERSADRKRQLEDGALLSYTSGSTGDPKAIVMTHGRLSTTMYAAAAAVVRHRGAPPQRVGCSMRLSGSGALNLHYTWALASGATVVVMPQLELSTARNYWREIEEYEVDQMFLVPPLIDVLNHAAAPRLRLRKPPICITGSSPLSTKTQDRFHRKFSVGLLNAFGLTETMCAAFFGEYDENGMGRHSIGQPALLKARLRNLEGEVFDGQGDGELELSGPVMFGGYFGNEAATQAAFRGSWFRTGDLLRRDEAGRMTTVGRIKDVVMKGSFAIYLNEIEEAANTLDGVVESAAVPIQLPDGGEDFGLLVRFHPGGAARVDEIAGALKQMLGGLRTPRRVIEIAQPLPRTGQEKLSRVALRALWQEVSGQAAMDWATQL